MPNAAKTRRRSSGRSKWRPKITPAAAEQMIREDVASLAKVVELRRADYLRALSEAARLNLAGGTIYDALIAAAARKAKASRLLTFNVSDFRRVWPDAGDRICEP